MKLVGQVFLLIFVFFIAVVAIGYFYHLTITPNSKLPFIFTAPIATPLPIPSVTATP